MGPPDDGRRIVVEAGDTRFGALHTGWRDGSV